MPINENVIVVCFRKDCYWFSSDMAILENNCAKQKVLITDKECDGFITKEEAQKRLARKG